VQEEAALQVARARNRAALVKLAVRSPAGPRASADPVAQVRRAVPGAAVRAAVGFRQVFPGLSVGQVRADLAVRVQVARRPRAHRAQAIPGQVSAGPVALGQVPADPMRLGWVPERAVTVVRPMPAAQVRPAGSAERPATLPAAQLAGVDTT